MSKRRRAPAHAPARANRRTGLKLAAVAAGMFTFGYALVPMYNVLCQVTGLNGKTGRAEEPVKPAADDARWVTVEFTGQTMAGLPWEFRPLQASLRVHPGEVAVAYYEARNPTGERITAQAVPSVSPGPAATHFKKIECFCFTQQTLKPGEDRKMPVRFVVDTKLPADVHTVTLSYAFFNTDKASAARYGGVRPAEIAEHQHDPARHAAPAGG